MEEVQNLAGTQDFPRSGAEPESLLPPQNTRVLLLALVLCLTFLAYLGTLWFDFVKDDQLQILGNAFLRSWRYLPRYFTGGVWTFRRPEHPGNFYRPLFLFWLRLNYVLFGTKPWGWHLTTVLAHVGATLCVFCLARRLWADWVGALFAGLIFGLHPVHIEGVAWVSGVPEPMLALLIIPSYLCFLRSRDKAANSRLWFIVSLALFVLAMLAKETALVLPLLIFATRWMEFEPRSVRGAKVWLRRCKVGLGSALPYLLLTIPYVVVRSHSLKGFAHPFAELSVLTYVYTWPSLLWFYLRHLFWPAGLSPYYDLYYVVHPGLRSVLLPAVPVLLFSVALAWWARRSRPAALASLWLVLPILPVMNIQVFGEGEFAHDRYLYLPSVGFAILAALALRRLTIGGARLLGQPALQVAVLLVLACTMGLSTTAQSACYANQTVYIATSVVGAPGSEIVKTNLAGLLGEQGHYEEALKIYLEVIKTSPDSAYVNYDVGYAYYLTGRLEEAEYYLTRATHLMPNPMAAYFTLGIAQFKMGHYADAAGNIRQALAISPYTDNYHFALGMVLKMQGDLPGALKEFQEELAVNPDHSRAREQVAEIEKALNTNQPVGAP